VETTLAKVLSLPRLSLRQVAGGANSSHAVRWVAVSELLDPTPYLEGGEILLTTGMNLPANDRRTLETYVQRLAGRGVVAVGLGVGLTHEEVPSALARAADRSSLPVFEVPPPTPFIAITRAVADLIADAEQDAVRRSLENQRLLTRAAARPNAEASVLRELSRLLGVQAAVLSAKGAVLAEAGPGQLPVATAAAEVHRIRPKGLRAASSSSVGDQLLQVFPLGTSGRPQRYLAVATPSGNTAENGLVATAVSLLSLAHERADSAAEMQSRLRRESARLLIDGDVSTATGVLVAATGHGIPPTVNVAVAEKPDEVSVGELLEDTDYVVYTELPDGSLVVVTDPEAGDRVVEALSAADFRIGVSEPVLLTAVSSGLQQARQALDALTTAGGQVGRFQTLLQQGVRGLVDRDAARAWAESTLAPLRAHTEGSRRIDLVATLEVFLAHHGQWHPAAAELGIHRHTLRYRIRLVEKLLGQSLNAPQTRMDLWFALQLAR
jgi:purine catabolism regulator